jgi:hypothetical protein
MKCEAALNDYLRAMAAVMSALAALLKGGA